jgi:hypothetical protein
MQRNNFQLKEFDIPKPDKPEPKKAKPHPQNLWVVSGKN